MAKYLPISPYTWPQDTLRIPNGQGLMPRIDFENGYNVRAEGAVYTTPVPFTFAPGTVSLQQILPIEADADFWVSEIAVFSVGAGVANLGPRLRIIDIRTGYNICNPYVRLGLFNYNALAGAETGVSGAPFRSTLIQPYSFTRNGGIRMLMDVDFTITAPQDFYLSFIGWKEYTYASQ